jgi:hypothetical protein
MSLEVVLAKPTRSSFRISIYMGSSTIMICFLRAIWKVLYVLNAMVASSQRCLFALICAAVPPPSISNWARPGKGGFTQAASGEITSYAIYEMMTPICPNDPLPIWVSI